MVRTKERYLLVNILYPELPGQKPAKSMPDFVVYHRPTEDNLTPQALARGIRAEVTSLFGDCGAGALERALQVKYLSTATSTFILRISRAHYRLVWAALTFMNRVPTKNGTPCTFRVVRVSGTMRRVEEECIRRAKLLVTAAREEAAGRSSDALDALFGGSKGPAGALVDQVDDGSDDEADDRMEEG